MAEQKQRGGPGVYRTAYSDDELVAAIREAIGRGVAKADLCDRVKPANLCAFLCGLPRPERDRLVAAAYAGQAQS